MKVVLTYTLHILNTFQKSRKKIRQKFIFAADYNKLYVKATKKIFKNISQEIDLLTTKTCLTTLKEFEEVKRLRGLISQP